jgi:hypothetical protein
LLASFYQSPSKRRPLNSGTINGQSAWWGFRAGRNRFVWRQ